MSKVRTSTSVQREAKSKGTSVTKKRRVITHVETSKLKQLPRQSCELASADEIMLHNRIGSSPKGTFVKYTSMKQKDKLNNPAKSSDCEDDSYHSCLTNSEHDVEQISSQSLEELNEIVKQIENIEASVAQSSDGEDDSDSPEFSENEDDYSSSNSGKGVRRKQTFKSDFDPSNCDSLAGGSLMNIQDIDESDSEAPQNEIKSHRLALEKLKQTDPEFYTFLTENDNKLLEFNICGEESDEDEVAIHKPVQLEVASDESDFEGDNDGMEASKNNLVTLKMIKTWERRLQVEQKSNSAITEVAGAFHAAMQSIAPSKDDKPGKYRVKGAAAFNGVIQICVLYLGPAVHKYLNLKRNAPASKTKKFTKVKTCLRQYFEDLAQLLRNVTSSNILNILLKHLHNMSSLLSSFSHATRPLLRILYTLWATRDESVRVIAFLVVLRIVRAEPQYLPNAMKSMYMAYVKNTKFISLNTLHQVNFMRRSLVEIYALDLTAAYAHVFLYVRQLAINLRNALVDSTRENVQVVCNWQFVSSCKLWGALLGQTADKPQLQPLIYPLVQVCLGTLRLVPHAAYYPMRFHLATILIDLSRESNVFIPLLSFLTQPLQTYNFNKKHTQISMKHLSFDALLRASKSQMSQNGFKDSLIEAVYATILEYAASHSHSVAFPDLVLLTTNHIRGFFKRCSNKHYKRYLHELLEVIEENSEFIQDQRGSLAMTLCERERVTAWETELKNRGTPLNSFYEKWLKTKMLKLRKQANKLDEIADYNLPTMRKHFPTPKSKDNGRVELLPSDSEDDEETLLEAKEPSAKRKRGCRGQQRGQAKDTTHPDHFDNMSEDHEDLLKDMIEW